ncbi:hypothetical protein ABZ419_17130 [Streptomyces cinnamoneus]|uniref:hypothetical protein n=1 Tax=Streptomyces cinnamoneus TaxID=53446 RepID=UPI003405D4B2
MAVKISMCGVIHSLASLFATDLSCRRVHRAWSEEPWPVPSQVRALSLFLEEVGRFAECVRTVRIVC